MRTPAPLPGHSGPSGPRLNLHGLRGSLAYAWEAYNTSLLQKPLMTKCMTGVVGTVLGDLLAQVSTYHFARQRHSAQSMHAQAYAGKGMYEEGLLQDRTGGGKRRGRTDADEDVDKDADMQYSKEGKHAPPKFVYDTGRVLRLCMWSVLVGTPLGHFWYLMLDKSVFPLAPTSTAAVLAKTALDQAIMAPLGTALFFYGFKLLEGGTPQEARANLVGKFKKTMMANYVLWPVAHIINFRFIPSEQRILYVNVIALAWTAYLSHMASQTTPATARAHDHTLELQHERHESEGTTAHATARSAGSATARKGSRHSTGAAESSQARHEDTSTQPASWWPWKKMFSGGSSGGLAARTASLSLSGLGAPPYAAAPAGAQRGQQQQGVLHAVEGEQMPAGKTAAAVMMKQPISNSWQGLDTPTGTLFASFDSRAQDYTFTYNNGAADSVAGSDAVADMVTGMHPPAPARSAFSTAMQRPVGKGQCGAAVGGTCGMSEGMDPGVHHAGSMPAGNRTSHRICNRIGSLRGTLKSPKASRSATQEGVMHTPPVHVKGDAGSMERSSQAKAMPAGSAGVLPVTRGSVQDGSISWSGAAACTHRAE